MRPSAASVVPMESRRFLWWQAAFARLQSTLFGVPYAPIYALVLLAGLALFLTGITHEGMLADEAYTANIVTKPTLQIIWLAHWDFNPPLHYILLHYWVVALGSSIFTLRLFSVLAALALAALGAGPIRRACGTAVGLTFTLLMVTAPGVLFKAQEARNYTLTLFLVTGVVVYSYLASKDNRAGDWIKLGIFTLAAAYTHYYALLAVAVIGLLLLIQIVASARHLLRPYLIVTACLILAYLPWLFVLAQQIQLGSQTSWISEISPNIIGRSIIYPFTYKDSFPDPSSESLLLLLGVVALALYGVFSAAKRRQPQVKLMLLALATYGLVLLIVVVASYLLVPVLWPRYLFVVAGLLLLPAAYGLANLPRTGYKLAGVALLLVLAAPILVRAQSQYFNGPIPQVEAYLGANIAPGDAFLFGDVTMASTFSYYHPANAYLYYTPSLTADEVASFMAAHKTVWLVSCGGAPGCATGQTWLAAQGIRQTGAVQNFTQPFSWLLISVVRVERSSALLQLP